MNRSWKCICGFFANMQLYDIFLIVFIILMLLQTGYTLIVMQPQSDSGNNIDEIFKTTTASIFGYLLSANFITRESAQAKRGDTSPASCSKINTDPYNMQVVIAFTIGFLSFIFLAFYRNFMAEDVFALEIISQLRDLLAGSIGFLIGMPPASVRKEVE